MTRTQPQGNRLFAGIASVAVVAIGVFFQYSYAAEQAPLATGAAELVDAYENTGADGDIEARLKARLARNPIDQRDFNLFYVLNNKAEVSEGNAPPLSDVLGLLGWRTTTAQQNLIVHAIASNDFEAIIERADALLRRERLTDEVLFLLQQVEAEPAVRDYLITSLERDPPWRSQFLEYTPKLREPGNRQARYETFMAMFDRGVEVRRFELAVILNALSVEGALDQAWTLFNRYNEVSSDLAKAASQPRDFDAIRASKRRKFFYPFPFEWKANAQRGVGVSTIEGANSTKLLLRWNGRGSPLLMSKFLRVESGKSYAVKIGGVSDIRQFANYIRISFVCPGKTVVYDDYTRNIDEDLLIYTAPETIDCDFPKVEVRGRPRQVDLPFKTQVEYITVEQI